MIPIAGTRSRPVSVCGGCVKRRSARFPAEACFFCRNPVNSAEFIVLTPWFTGGAHHFEPKLGIAAWLRLEPRRLAAALVVKSDTIWFWRLGIRSVPRLSPKEKIVAHCVVLPEVQNSICTRIGVDNRIFTTVIEFAPRDVENRFFHLENRICTRGRADGYQRTAKSRLG